MSAQPQVELSGARWSSAVRCQRKAFYEFQDAPQSPPSEQMQRWWRRGKAVEAAIRGEIFAELREDGRRPRAEEVIPWGAEFGFEGHLDAWIPSEQMAIEIKSNGQAALTEFAALQVAGYAIHHPRAEHAVVIAVDSNSFEQRSYPIDIAGLEPRVREIEEAVVEGCRSGEPPERVCKHPGDEQAFFCQFAEHCFSSWTRPEPDVLLLDEEAVSLADATDLVTRLSRETDAAKAQRDHVRDELRPYMDPGVPLESPSMMKLQRTEVAGRETLSLGDMRKAGVQLPDELKPFVSVGKPSERWVVKRRA
ncbi:MAG TPA: hypothetical protein VGQ45_03910 [Gaiellales bacterium]|nr:hypothetical protein [Gaiellales bacterium]